MASAIKVSVVGDARVGKTSILANFQNKEFSDSYMSTMGVDYVFKEYSINDKKVSLQIWDTAGQEHFRPNNSNYSGSSAIVFVYDLTNMDSFNNIHKWVEEAKKSCPDTTQMYFVGNKSDLETRVVSDSDIETLVNTYKFKRSYKLSAKKDVSPKSLFNDILQDYIDTHEIS